MMVGRRIKGSKPEVFQIILTTYAMLHFRNRIKTSLDSLFANKRIYYILSMIGPNWHELYKPYAKYASHY